MTDLRKVLILGAGFGGLTAGTVLDAPAGAGKLQVTLVERNYRFSMGFTAQWVLAGRRSPEEGHRSYASLRARHVKFINDEIVGIDTTQQVVETRSHNLDYDSLIITLGAELAPELVPGLSESAYNLCDLEAVIQLKSALSTIKEGTVLIAISSLPFKCPPAPYEYAFLIDESLRNQGVRDKIRLIITTPEPQPLPVAGKAIGDTVKAMLREREIEFLPGHKPKQVDLRVREVIYEDGSKLQYNILAAMPPHRAPRVVRDAGIADASGFVPVELGTFMTATPNVYAAGDVAAIKLPNGNPHPKAGVFAEAQALTIAKNITSELGGAEVTKYEGVGKCFVDAGGGKAVPMEAHLLEPSGPRILFPTPTEEALHQKREFERERFLQWFGD